MLTTTEIHSKEFKRSFRGYDVDEVNDFLDQIIRDYDLIIREKMELEQQVEELQAELERVMEGESMYANSQQQPPVQEVPVQQTPSRFAADNAMQSLQPTAAALTSMEQSIHKSIRVAQEVADEVRLNAKKEAELIVQEAEKNADRIINEALTKARAIHTELLDLKQKSTIYRTRFRTLVQSHLDILENSDWNALEEIEEGLDEHDKQLEELSEVGDHQDYMIDNTLPTIQHDFNDEDALVMDEVAVSYMEEEEEPRRELRRTSRKLKKKAMF
ncbi:DivIVA domain-containing protein [Shimazuella alba]|uniref:DivIVA domain-containing protein n=1 Tax=Shimazuella alba TaxID=2690964 RepID=A0A6I4VSJ7_9BACL|nr:DivIVA domain-containing protein [Shimazuella alba]